MSSAMGAMAWGMSKRVVSAMAMVVVVLAMAQSSEGQGGQSSWALLHQNVGIASMHTAVTYTGQVLFLDRTDIGPSLINLANGVCRDNQRDLSSQHDCSSHSLMFNPADNSVRPLLVQTDTWCSSGQFLPNGTLMQTGGYNDGVKRVRWITPCGSDGSCDWVESSTDLLQAGRWYASNQLLPDGRMFVLGGQYSPTYEFIPSNGMGLFNLPLLESKNYFDWYPFIHLLPDGTLYIFANRDSCILDYNSNTVVKTFPTIPGEPRNYPCAGSSVMLALESGGTSAPEVLICGGASIMAPGNITAQFPASQTCGRLRPLDTNPNWAMQDMPIRRNMGDMVMLPNSQILIINGAQNGAQGWDTAASNPALNPVIYDPNAWTFEVQPATYIPRMYHSTANLLTDGRVLVAGSNCHIQYTFVGEFPTELRVEAFQPAYTDPVHSSVKPQFVANPTAINYAAPFNVQVSIPSPAQGVIGLTITSSPFTTHSYSQGQRQVKLVVSAPVLLQSNVYGVTGNGPLNPNVAPSSWYMLHALHQGIPSYGIWVQVQ
ncbi:hypothetical protein KC19_10G117000 [Ceratodon purpureus]|uniref:Galactose oxidase n=1 Tax=Ceratodon purpureus TaxID=3225 RepID=A0A8T0GLZ4_CERPU|nr:hypothetical protein KC19_10G117000 [Ceratodon purpureus]